VSTREGDNEIFPINMEICSETGKDARMLAIAEEIEKALGIKDDLN
jgi:Asp-tRNA(Asn)/Glu-tRNA(Gln) amidotransferase A subunit family amidase